MTLNTRANTSKVSQQSEQIADQQEQIDNLGSPEPPEFVDSVEEMTDTSESYVNTQTGTIWVCGDDVIGNSASQT